MASAQALPNSSRKDHLEAGKKKLEEFRKQRKAKAGKKAEPFTQNEPNLPPKTQTGTKIPDEPALNNTNYPKSIVHSSSNGFIDTLAEKTAKTNNSNLQESSFSISNIANGYHDDWREKNDDNFIKKTEPLLSNSNFARYKEDPVITIINNPEFEASNSIFLPKRNIPEVSQSGAILSHPNQLEVSTSQVGFVNKGEDTAYSNLNILSSKENPFLPNNLSTSKENHPISTSKENPFLSNPRSASKENPFLSNPISASKESPFLSNNLSSKQNPFLSNPISSKESPFLSNNLSASKESPFLSNKSRPSFLDSIGVTRISNEEPENKPNLFFLNHENAQDLNKKESSFGAEQGFKYQNVPSKAKDEDFTALEQLIEDLTIEKFSLQRALDASKSIADSLTSDNASLTEDYNRQGKVINQLKYEMEKLQDEIKAQLLALETLRGEYMNAQLECNAADERANLLASEVITLEEKALRLRSNELKLEKQVESLNSEISSFKRKFSSLERERQDFQSTINALLEEQKLLHAKIRNTPTNENVIKDSIKTIESRTNASTATDDLGECSSVQETVNNTAHVNTAQDVNNNNNNNNSDISFSLEDFNGALPSDQIRMIDNISSLISELSVEREELMQALRIESSNCSKLKDLNKDLTQKLETQTQRLELMAAERMANGNTVIPNPSDSSNLSTETTLYADEGDEVVERVLGWIIKLFPGGPAKRRTSKLI